MKNIKIIFFDVGGVILKKKYDLDEKAAAYLKINPQIYKDQVSDLVDTEEAGQRWQAICDLEKERDFQFWFNREILNRLNLEPDEEKINYLSNFRLNRTPHYELVEGALETLDYLEDKYQLAIISNAPPSRRICELKDFNLAKYFEPIILSGEVQIYKPDEKIFQIALKSAQAKPEEAVMIDNEVENLQAAKSSGFGQCLLFNSDGVIQEDFKAINYFSHLKNLF